jgi:hypothetical protein
MDVFVTVLAQTAMVKADMNATEIRLPATDMQIKKRVCFVKMSVRPKADLTFSSCNSTCEQQQQQQQQPPLPLPLLLPGTCSRSPAPAAAGPPEPRADAAPASPAPAAQSPSS